MSSLPLIPLPVNNNDPTSSTPTRSTQSSASQSTTTSSTTQPTSTSASITTPTPTPTVSSSSSSSLPTSTAQPTTTDSSSPAQPTSTPSASPTSSSSQATSTPVTQTTVLRTVTRGDGQPSVIVVTQTLPSNPTSTGTANPSSTSSNSNDGNSNVLTIAIPCAIAGVIALVGLALLIRWLKNRSAAARAAEDIKWPEVVNSDGDRAALYPEPTRPGMGHGLGDEEEEHAMSTNQMSQISNFAGAGAGNRTIMQPSNLSPTNTGSVTTYLNSSSMQDHNNSTNHPQFYSAAPFLPPPLATAPSAGYSTYYNNSANAPQQAYPPAHPGVLLPAGGLHGPREMQQQYAAPDFYSNGHQDYLPDKAYSPPQEYVHHQHPLDEHDYHKQQDEDPLKKEYDDPLAAAVGHEYPSHPTTTDPAYPAHQQTYADPQSHQTGHSPPRDAAHLESPGSPSDENFYCNPSSRLSDHHHHHHHQLDDDISPDYNPDGAPRRLVALNPDEDP